MAAPWRGGSRPADGGFPTAPADSDQPQRPNWSTSQPDVMVAGHSYSTSGTFSTTYTSSWGSAVVSSGVEDEVEDAKRLDLTKCLLKEFCRGDGDAVSALESWLSEMGVGWVLQPSDNASAGTTGLLPDDQRNLSQKRSLWIGALTAIMESIRACKYSDPSNWIWDLGIPFHITNFRLGRLVQATVVKMFPFVDALVATAADLDATDGIITDVGNRAHVLLGKLQPLLDVRNALSSASQVIEFSYWEFSEETKVIRRSDKARSLLSAKTRKLDEAIWNTMEEIRIGILTTNDDDDTELGIQTPQGSSDIANYTRSLMAYIKSLWNNSKLLDKIVRTATELGRYIPDPDISSYLLLLEKRKADPLTVLTLKMVFSLQVKLAKRSESFADNGLRFLFLINNTNFIYQQLRPFFSMKFLLAVLISKKEEYIQKYLQVSWAPVLSCLNNQTPRWFGKKTKSALPKFDSEFQKTYDEQKFWKVPDPQLRTRLRQAIIERVVPAFTKYLKDNKITKPGFTPQEREMMLWELFEG